MMFCGAGSFKDVDKEEGGGKPAAAAAAPAAKAKKAGSKTKGKDNPYASRGLDKFSTVLSELESKRERILRRVGPDVDADRLMVRFVQSEAKGWVPVVVKLPTLEEEQAAADAKKRQQSKPGKPTSRPSTPPTEPASPKEAPAGAQHVAPLAQAAVPAKRSKARGVRWAWAWGRKQVMRPCHYCPLAMALLLLLLSLVVFGRVFAICCTSIWWYLLPILNGEEALCATKARKGVGNKAAGDRPAAAVLPPSHGKRNSSGAALEVISPRSHAHRKG